MNRSRPRTYQYSQAFIGSNQYEEFAKLDNSNNQELASLSQNSHSQNQGYHSNQNSNNHHSASEAQQQQGEIIPGGKAGGSGANFKENTITPASLNSSNPSNNVSAVGPSIFSQYSGPGQSHNFNKVAYGKESTGSTFVDKGLGSENPEKKRRIQGYSYFRLRHDQNLPKAEVYELRDGDIEFLNEFNQTFSQNLQFENPNKYNELLQQQRQRFEEGGESFNSLGDDANQFKIQNIDKVIFIISEEMLERLFIHFEKKSTKDTTATFLEVKIELPQEYEEKLSSEDLDKLYQYWKREREREYERIGEKQSDKQKELYPLMRKYWRAQREDNNAHAAFRPRDAVRMRTRKSARPENKETYEKMLSLEADFKKYRLLALNLKKRELLKREIAFQTITEFNKSIPGLTDEFQITNKFLSRSQEIKNISNIIQPKSTKPSQKSKPKVPKSEQPAKPVVVLPPPPKELLDEDTMNADDLNNSNAVQLQEGPKKIIKINLPKVLTEEKKNKFNDETKKVQANGELMENEDNNNLGKMEEEGEQQIAPETKKKKKPSKKKSEKIALLLPPAIPEGGESQMDSQILPTVPALVDPLNSEGIPATTTAEAVKKVKKSKKSESKKAQNNSSNLITIQVQKESSIVNLPQSQSLVQDNPIINEENAQQQQGEAQQEGVVPVVVPETKKKPKKEKADKGDKGEKSQDKQEKGDKLEKAEKKKEQKEPKEKKKKKKKEEIDEASKLAAADGADDKGDNQQLSSQQLQIQQSKQQLDKLDSQSIRGDDDQMTNDKLQLKEEPSQTQVSANKKTQKRPRKPKVVESVVDPETNQTQQTGELNIEENNNSIRDKAESMQVNRNPAVSEIIKQIPLLKLEKDLETAQFLSSFYIHFHSLRLPITMENIDNSQKIIQSNTQMQEEKKLKLKNPNTLPYLIRKRLGRSNVSYIDRTFDSFNDIIGIQSGKISYILTPRNEIIYNTYSYVNLEAVKTVSCSQQQNQYSSSQYYGSNLGGPSSVLSQSSTAANRDGYDDDSSFNPYSNKRESKNASDKKLRTLPGNEKMIQEVREKQRQIYKSQLFQTKQEKIKSVIQQPYKAEMERRKRRLPSYFYNPRAQQMWIEDDDSNPVESDDIFMKSISNLKSTIDEKQKEKEKKLKQQLKLQQELLKKQKEAELKEEAARLQLQKDEANKIEEEKQQQILLEQQQLQQQQLEQQQQLQINQPQQNINILESPAVMAQAAPIGQNNNLINQPFLNPSNSNNNFNNPSITLNNNNSYFPDQPFLYEQNSNQQFGQIPSLNHNQSGQMNYYGYERNGSYDQGQNLPFQQNQLNPLNNPSNNLEMNEEYFSYNNLPQLSNHQGSQSIQPQLQSTQLQQQQQSQFPDSNVGGYNYMYDYDNLNNEYKFDNNFGNTSNFDNNFHYPPQNDFMPNDNDYLDENLPAKFLDDDI